MTIRRQKQGLYLIGTLALLGVVATGVAAVRWPYGQVTAQPETRPRPQTQPADDNASESLPSRSAFAALDNKPWRRRLFKPKPQPEPQQEKEPPPPPLRIEVTATIIEPGHKRAMINGQNGQPALVEVGDILGPDGHPAQVTDITKQGVKVHYHDKVKLLPRQQDESN
jgi:hypothetical protein